MAGAVGAVTGRPPDAIRHDSLLTFAVIVFMLAASVDRRLAITGVAYVVGYAIVPWVGHPELVTAGCSAVLLVNTLTLWGRFEDLDVARGRVGRQRAARRRRLEERLDRSRR